MKYFTSDIHFADNRLNLFQRDLHFKSSEDFDKKIIKMWNDTINDDDIVYLLGDIVHDITKIDILSKLKGHKILIIGNYDEKHTEILSKYFDSISDNLIINIDGIGSVF
jgi:calcineurin-like phosphoesterase family protein